MGQAKTVSSNLTMSLGSDLSPGACCVGKPAKVCRAEVHRLCATCRQPHPSPDLLAGVLCSHAGEALLVDRLLLRVVGLHRHCRVAQSLTLSWSHARASCLGTMWSGGRPRRTGRLP